MLLLRETWYYNDFLCLCYAFNSYSRSKNGTSMNGWTGEPTYFVLQPLLVFQKILLETRTPHKNARGEERLHLPDVPFS